MSGDRMKLTVKERDALGSAESRRLRRNGWVPGVLYGKGSPRAIVVAERELRTALTGASGLHAVVDVVLDGQKTEHPSILKDYQQDPIRGHVSHVDFQEVPLDQTIQASVTIELQGGEDAPGVREGGVLSQPTLEVRIEALPLEVPERLSADVSGMQMGDTLRLEDLQAPDGVTFLDDPAGTVIATVTAPTVVVEPEEEVEEAVEGELAEGEEAEAGAEGEASAEAAESAEE
jgi:large subunit ribosomal protein L25